MSSIEWTQQEDLLDSYINVEEYDKVLLLLESTLFTSPPKLLCPSSFVIRILFTLCTLEDYYNADFIRTELKNSLSDIPISQRAYQLLRNLIDLVKNHNYGDHDDNLDPFKPIKFDNTDINFAKIQLIDSLKFVADASNRYNLRKLNSKRNYKEKPPPSKLTPKKAKISLLDINNNALNWSPERIKLEKEFYEVSENKLIFEHNVSSDNDSDDSFLKTSDRKSLKILKNDRIDIALRQNKIWIAIQLCFKNGLNNTNSLIFKNWKMWNNLLLLFIDIFEMELHDYINDSNKDKLFENTLLFKFLDTPIKYSWNLKFPELLLNNRNFKSNPIFKYELIKAKSVLIDKYLQDTNNPKQISIKNSLLFNKLFFLTCNSIILRKYDISDPTNSKWNLNIFIRSFTELLIKQGNYFDYLNFFQITNLNKFKIQIYENILMISLVQITTDDFNQFTDYEWLFNNDAESLNFILDLFENITFTEKCYQINNELQTDRLIDDYNKLNLVLYYILKLWLYASKTNLDLNLIKKLINCAKIGEGKRLKITKSIYKKSEKDLDEDELKHLSAFLRQELNQVK